MHNSEDNTETIDFQKAKIVSTYNEMTRNYADKDDLISKLTRKLQTSLDTRKIVELFSDELANTIDYRQFSFENEDGVAFVSGDSSGIHSCQFNLTLDHTVLGSIKLSRKKRFMEEELAIIERLASTLVFPLNNARLYHAALQSALIDELTGLGNKRALQSDLHREAERAVRNKKPFSLMLLDIDHFKKINDTHGHPAGDHVLKNLARTLQSCARQSDLCFRYGGEEFLVILDNASSLQAALISERFRCVIAEQNIYFGNKAIPVTASIGCATFRPGEPLENLIARADKALYSAKGTGRNKCVCAEDMSEAPKRRKTGLTKSA